MGIGAKALRTIRPFTGLVKHPLLRMTGAVVWVCTLGGVFAALVPSQVTERGYPAWLGLALLLGGLLTVAFVLLDFERATFLSFTLMGFVRIEPAPFDLLMMLLLGIGLLTGRLRYPARPRAMGFRVGLWGLALASIASAIGVMPIGHSLRFLIISLYVLALCAFVRMYAFTEAGVRRVVNGYVISAVVSSLLVVVGFLGIGPAQRLFLKYGIRAQGFFKDPNVFAPFLIFPILLITDRVIRRPFSWKYTVPRVILIILLCNSVVLSFSRGAWINLALSGFVYLGLLSRLIPRRKTAALVFSLTLIALIVVLSVQLAGLGSFVSERGHLKKSYDEQRFENQATGVIAGLSHIMGVGPGRWPNTHSLYACTLAEHGLPGLAMLVVLSASVVRGLSRQAWQEPLQVEILPTRVLLSCLVGQLVNSFVIDSIHWRHLWVLMGLAWVSLENR